MFWCVVHVSRLVGKSERYFTDVVYVEMLYVHSTFTSGKKSGALKIVMSSMTRTLFIEMTLTKNTCYIVRVCFCMCMQIDRAEHHILITLSGCIAVRHQSHQ